MPKKAKKAGRTRDARYEAFRAEWELRRRHRLQRQRGRGKPGDMDYRPPVVGSPRPHKTNAAEFLDELLWLGTYVGNDCFGQAYIAVQESGAIKDRKWAKDFRVSSPPRTYARPVSKLHFYRCSDDSFRWLVRTDGACLGSRNIRSPRRVLRWGRHAHAQGAAGGDEGRTDPFASVTFATP